MKSSRAAGRMGRRCVAASAIVALLLVAGGGAAEARVGQRDHRKRAAVADGIVAQVLVRAVAVFQKPGDAAPKLTLPNPTENGGPRVFLVDKQRDDGWVRVYLPVRPNHSRGWIRATDVRLALDPYRIKISYAKHRIAVYRGEQRVLREPVGLGRKITPTPGGTYYLTELYDVPNAYGPYGPYAFALSGFSETLTSFNGTDAIIGIHGTNDPAGLGHDVSHGCIRMSNAGITVLAGTLPLGTPVQIKA